MGRSTTPAYRVEIVESVGNFSNFGWDKKETKHFGKPNIESLKKFIESYNESFGPNGVNSHIGGKICAAQLVRQSNNDVIATYRIA